jgi:hypothetical protein
MKGDSFTEQTYLRFEPCISDYYPLSVLQVTEMCDLRPISPLPQSNQSSLDKSLALHKINSVEFGPSLEFNRDAVGSEAPHFYKT